MKKQKISVILDNQILHDAFVEIISTGHFTNIDFQFHKTDEDLKFQNKIAIVQNSIDLVLKCKNSNVEKIYFLHFNKVKNISSNHIDIVPIKLPIKFNDFILQISNDLHQSDVNKSRIVVLNNYKYDPSSRLLTDGKVSLRFTEKESQIFLCLINNARRSLKKRELLDLIWNYGEGIDTHTLETHIYSLRKKIDKGLNVKNAIRFEENKGYSLSKFLL